MFIGRTDVEAETPILWPPDEKSWLIWKDPDAGKHWGQEEKGMTENEMAGWHYRLNGHEFEWTPGVGDGQGGLVCCGSWDRKRVGHDWATQLNWTECLCQVLLLSSIDIIVNTTVKFYREYILHYDKYFPKLRLEVKYIFSTYTYMFWSLEWLFYALSSLIVCL